MIHVAGPAPRRGCIALFLASIVFVTSGSGAFAAPPDAPAATWTITARLPEARFTGVSCASAAECVAVGTAFGPGLTAIWRHGVWAVAPSNDAGLDAVSCFAAGRCVAVGSYRGSDYVQPRTDFWNGNAWSIMASPQTSTNDALRGVSCVAGPMCMAVGTARVYGNSRPLVQIWTGGRWSIIATPLLPSRWSGGFSAVSCLSTTFCVAVGDRTRYQAPTRTLIEIWNGKSWSIMPSPHGSDWRRSLASVSCTSPTSCFAVGGLTATEYSTSRTLVERWDGTRWSVLRSPNPNPTIPNVQRELSGVSCVSATSCVAVGSAWIVEKNGSSRALIASWDGTGWSASRDPTSRWAYGSKTVTGVSCTTARCVAVGYVARGLYDVTEPSINAIALTRDTPLRSVRVSWTAGEDARLRQIAGYLHVDPAGAQKLAVYTTAYLTALGPRTPTPVTLPRPGTARSYTNEWTPDELEVLDSVRAKFALDAADATRASVYLVSYLYALRGH